MGFDVLRIITKLGCCYVRHTTLTPSMTPDQIAVSSLRVQEVQTWITGLAIFLGPLAGVLFTLWFQSRKERNDAKHQLFLALMAERKAPRVTPQLAQALNKIDVVFANSAKVKTCWHEYYTLLHQAPGEPRTHKWLELLTTIAQDLGYSQLSPIDLDKFYLPQGHVDDAEFQQKVGLQWARVLENTEHFVVKARDANET
jgi:hypothetical protein